MSIRVPEIYDALIEAGASEAKARASAESVLISDQLATKSDLFAHSCYCRLSTTRHFG